MDFPVPPPPARGRMTAITFAVIAFVAVSGILVGWNALHAYISPGDFLRSYGVDLPGASSSSAVSQGSSQSSMSSMSASGASLSSEGDEDSSIPPIPDLGDEIIPPIPNLSDIIDELRSGSMSSSSEEDLPIPDLGDMNSSASSVSSEEDLPIPDLGDMNSSASSVSSEEDTPTDLPIPDLGDIIRSSSSSETSSAAASSAASIGGTGGGGSTRNPVPAQDWPAPWRNITGGYNRDPVPAIVPSEPPDTGTIANPPTLTIEPENVEQMPFVEVPALATNPVPEMAAAPVQPPTVPQQPPAIPESIAALIPPSVPTEAAAPAPPYDATGGAYAPPATAPATVPAQSAQPAMPPSYVPLRATVAETPTAAEETPQTIEQVERAPLPGSGTPLTMIFLSSPLIAAGLYALMRRRRAGASHSLP